MKIAILCVLIASLALGAESPARGADKKSAAFGRYIGRVAAEWKGPRSMILLEDFAYLDPSSIEWKAAKGSSVDGASIPQFAWSFVGGPFEGAYREASVIHDVACVEKARQWRDVHRAFYNAMRASGVGELKAKVMYAAVYHFGPRWTVARDARCSLDEFAGRTSCASTRLAGSSDPNFADSYLTSSPSVSEINDEEKSRFRSLVLDIARSGFEGKQPAEPHAARMEIFDLVGVRIPRDSQEEDPDAKPVTLEQIESFMVLR